LAILPPQVGIVGTRLNFPRSLFQFRVHIVCPGKLGHTIENEKTQIHDR